MAVGKGDPVSETTAQRHILLVDDEPAVGRVLTKHLERMGYRVTPCTAGDVAVETFRADPAAFDLVVTDYRMPGTNGFQLCEALAATRPDLPALVCTGNPGDLPPREEWPATLRGALNKPVTSQELAAAVAQALQP